MQKVARPQELQRGADGTTNDADLADSSKTEGDQLSVVTSPSFVDPAMARPFRVPDDVAIGIEQVRLRHISTCALPRAPRPNRAG